MFERGVALIAIGEKARAELNPCLNALKKHSSLPTAIISDTDVPGRVALSTIGRAEGLNSAQASRWAKVNLLTWSPFLETLYLDVDTRVMGKIDAGFDALRDGWDIAMAPSTSQGQDCLWHVTKPERDETLTGLGYEPLQLQAGVMFVRKTDATRNFFNAWRDEWKRYRGEDQGAFLRALKRSPARIWLLGNPWNGGAVIKHLFGKVREQ